MPFGPRVSDGEPRGSEQRSATRVEAGAPVDPNSFWDEASSSIQGVVDAPPQAEVEKARATGGGASRGPRPSDVREHILRPWFIGGAVAAAVLVFACVKAVGLVTARGPIGKSSDVSHRVASTGGRSTEYASTPSWATIGARVVAGLRFRESVSAAHQARYATGASRRSVSRARPHTSATRAVSVSYQQTAPVNDAGTASGEAASYQPPPPATSSPPQTSATSASTSGGSGSDSGSGPSRGSPTGVLTCISNCG